MKPAKATTPDDSVEINPLARQLHDRHGVELQAVLFRCSCLSADPVGVVHGRTATDDECRRVRAAVDAFFYIDVTVDIAQQVVDGIRFVIGNLTAEADRLEEDIAAGKYPLDRRASVETPRRR